jgi:hypothetical protein
MNNKPTASLPATPLVKPTTTQQFFGFPPLAGVKNSGTEFPLQKTAFTPNCFPQQSNIPLFLSKNKEYHFFPPFGGMVVYGPWVG